MDATGWLRFLTDEFRFLHQLWLLDAGRLPFAVWLVVLAGLAFTQLSRRPRTVRWLLAALGVMILWEGGGGAVLKPHIAGLWNNGDTTVDLKEEVLVWIAWTVLPWAVQCVVAACVLKAAFGKARSAETNSAEGAV